ncbi:MAG TPA: hypothetical protein ENH94_07580 [Phycisphaerales bacterium]|nr:hypothetical protein [Phycisphaerales bacterium]
MQAERIFYHRPMTDRAVYHPIGYAVLAMIIAAGILQGCRSGVQYSFSSPSSGAGRQMTPGSFSALLSTSANTGDFTFAGPTTTLPEEPGWPGFFQSNYLSASTSGPSSFSGPASTAGSLESTRTEGKAAMTRPGDRSLGNVYPKTAPDLDRLLDAIVLVESSGRLDAVNDGENAVGAYQIRPIFLRDVNRILGCDRYKLDDRWDPVKSRQMAAVYLANYGQGKTIIQMARQYNGGPSGHIKRSTLAYAAKIQAILN